MLSYVGHSVDYGQLFDVSYKFDFISVRSYFPYRCLWNKQKRSFDKDRQTDLGGYLFDLKSLTGLQFLNRQ